MVTRGLLVALMVAATAPVTAQAGAVAGARPAGAAGAAGGVSVAVEGVVRSSEAEAPLAYARVQVVGDTLADWTDERGVYRLEGLPRGEWQLRVVHGSHDSLDLAVFVPGDRPVRIDVTLNAVPGPAVDALADFEPFRMDYTLPALLNPTDMASLMQRLYPEELTRDGIGGEAVLRLWLDERGRVVKSLVSSSSGSAALDAVALTVADSMRFRPARSRQEGVRVIVLIPVVFTVPTTGPDGSGAEREAVVARRDGS